MIDSGPPASTTQTTASFSFSSDQGGASFQCKLDSGSWAGCSSPASYGSLAVGAHSFSVRAVSAGGDLDASPAASSWTVRGATAAASCPRDDDQLRSAGEHHPDHGQLQLLL